MTETVNVPAAAELISSGPGAQPESTRGLDLALDLRRTRAIVLTWPDHSLTWETAAWLYHLLPPENILAFCGTDLIVARNLSIRELVLKASTEITDFIFMDRDMRPGAAAMCSSEESSLSRTLGQPGDAQGTGIWGVRWHSSPDGGGFFCSHLQFS